MYFLRWQLLRSCWSLYVCGEAAKQQATKLHNVNGRSMLICVKFAVKSKRSGECQSSLISAVEFIKKENG